MGATSTVGGLEVVFDWAIDGGAWLGPVRTRRSATVGKTWLGPLGLLGRLELELGLGGVYATPTERTADLANRLRDRDGFWARSFEVDPIATTTRLLADRDALVLAGWQGQPSSERLDSLWSATSHALPGQPDRVRQVILNLARRRVDVTIVYVLEPVTTLPQLWQQMFASLRCAGVLIIDAPLHASDATGDLGGARASGFVPTGDGSLQLVRPYGPLAAAEEVAATLAASQDLRDVVVVGADAVLDAAFVRHGLPRLGADIPSPGSCALVRLCIESAFHPMNAADLHALLCADPGPVPRRIAWRLVAALRRFPGRDSAEWREGIAAGLDAIGDDKRQLATTRIAALLDPIAERTSALTIDQLASRMSALHAWASSRLSTDPTLAEVIALIDRLLAIATLYGAGRFQIRELRRLCDEVSQPRVTGQAAELGLSSVWGPGAVLGPARIVVWWGFSRDRAPTLHRLRLSGNERTALATAGVTAPDESHIMAHEARRWRRPLTQATTAMILVCPQFDEAGKPAHLHPLWDELVSTIAATGLEARLCAPAMTLPTAGAPTRARRERAVLRATPLPIAVACVPHAIPLRTTESASSIEQLLGCSFAYVLHYAGKLRSGLGGGPSEPSPLLYGNLGHHVLAHVFAGGAIPPAAAASAAAAIFDGDLPRLTETLLLPDHQAKRATARRAIVESARVVAAITAQTGATIRGVELPLEGAFSVAAMSARADLVLADPDYVIDFKWGASTSRENLRAGAAVQLAIYAELAREGAALPGAAYLILGTQRLLATRGTELPGAIVPTLYSANDMLYAARAALDARVAELTAGNVVAPSALEDAPKSQLEAGVLQLAPSCSYCELAGLCGRRGRS